MRWLPSYDFVAAVNDSPPGMRGAAVWKIRSAVRKFCSEHQIDNPMVACSGGADSLALAIACSQEFTASHALIIDHRLQAGSADIAHRAVEALARYSMGATVIPVDVDPRDGGMENAARNARYEALQAHREHRAVLLAHTGDDQAETVLLGLARGSGTRSLQGMSPWRAPFGRPLLQLRRSDTEAALADIAQPYYQDPHNTDTRFTRVQVRATALPHLAEVLGPSVISNLMQTAQLCREDNDALDMIASHLFDQLHSPQEEDKSTLQITEQLQNSPVAVVARVVRQWCACNGVSALTSVHIRHICALIFQWKGQGPVFVPTSYSGGSSHQRLVVARAHGKLLITTAAD